MSLARPSAPTVLRLGCLYLLLLWPPAARGDCSSPPEVPNAHLDLRGLSSFPVNSTVTYRCNEGFVKVPGQTDSVICLGNDQWSEISEFCNRSCNVSPQLQFAMLKKIYSSQNYFPVGSTVEYECRLGYRRVPGRSGTLTCLQNLEWSKPAEFCTKKSCTHPGELSNGQINVKTDFLFGATINFLCDKGYKLIGAKHSICVIIGDDVGWTEPLPTCRVIHCQEPPKIENGRIVRGDGDYYVYNQAVMYECNRGFTLIGEDTIHCTAKGDEGEWSGPPPQCRGSHSVSRPRVEWRHHSSLPPKTPGLKRFSCLSLLSSWDFRHALPRPANLYIFCRNRVLLCCSAWSVISGLKRSSRLGLRKC
ncbi:complement decay-accelerating factor isoform X4 [Microcebus murinus]|uniref:complement decay-accelerating factor isoform X4 n=1 Tax=Microcebus murinus TaxID=30608 RepID=UPI003F6D6D99